MKIFTYNFIAVCIFCLLICLIEFISVCNTNALKKQPVFTKGNVTEVITFSKSAGITIRYRFKSAGNYYNGNGELDCSKSHELEINNYMVGRGIPVVYQASRPGNSMALLSYEDCKEYKYKPSADDSVVINKLSIVCQ